MNGRNRKRENSAGLRKIQLQVEAEKLSLMFGLRQAEQQLKCLNLSGVTDLLEQDKDKCIVRANHFRERLQSVRETEQRLQAGKFGTCESCGEEIGEKMLRVMPTAQYCLRCQEAYEREVAFRRFYGVLRDKESAY